GGFDTAHIGFIYVDTFTDEFVALISWHDVACRIPIGIRASTHFGNFVFEVCIEQSQTGRQVLSVIPDKTDFLTNTFLWLEIGITHDDCRHTAAATRNLPPVGDSLTQTWCLKASGYTTLDAERICGMPDTVQTRRP